MPDTSARLEGLTGTATTENGRRFEMTFQAMDGSKHTLSLPLRVAADMTPIFADLSSKLEQATGGPSFSKRIKSWAVGRSNETPEVLLRLGDLALAIHVDDAKKMWREIREEADAISRRGPQPRH